MGQSLERREEHFVRKQLRGQNPLQHESFDQGVNHTDQVLWRHGELALISQCAEP